MNPTIYVGHPAAMIATIVILALCVVTYALHSVAEHLDRKVQATRATTTKKESSK